MKEYTLHVVRFLENFEEIGVANFVFDYVSEYGS
jgi:hypothetical protein